MELGDPRMEDPEDLEAMQMNECTHPASQQRAVSDYEEIRVENTLNNSVKTFVRETVICDACGQRRTLRTPLVDAVPESGIYRRCPDCGVRVFTTARDGKLGSHECSAADR